MMIERLDILYSWEFPVQYRKRKSVPIKAVLSFIAIKISFDVHKAVFASACSSQHLERERARGEKDTKLYWRTPKPQKASNACDHCDAKKKMSFILYFFQQYSLSIYSSSVDYYCARDDEKRLSSRDIVYPRQQVKQQIAHHEELILSISLGCISR
jgi:hypothetical protein